MREKQFSSLVHMQANRGHCVVHPVQLRDAVKQMTQQL
jgi:hypothetical protein